LSTVNLLYKAEIPINDNVKIIIPSVRDILKDEDGYYAMVSCLTAMPIDMMCQLDDIGIDFTTIDAYELFLLLFQGLKDQDTSLIFGDLDLSKFEMAINEENGKLIMLDRQHDIIIDKAIYDKISTILRNIHGIEKDNRKPANAQAKSYMLERARAKMKRNKNKAKKSQLEPLIISMVCTEQYKYDFNSTLDLSIYQFNECVKQIMRKVAYDNRMIGVYAGTVSTKELSRDDLNWLVQ